MFNRMASYKLERRVRNGKVLYAYADKARILEKQNRFQMSQVFPFRASMIKWVLLFKDSMSGTEERVKLPDSHTNCKCTRRSKTKRCPPRGIAWTLPLANFGPA